MSGRVVCGLCKRRMSIMRNGQGESHYRCRHRGSSCKLSSRSNLGLLRAAGLGLSLLCDDSIRQAVRRHLEADGRKAHQRRRPPAPGVDERLTELRDQRDKLLHLHYAGHISADQFGDEQARLTVEIDNLEADAATDATEELHAEDVAARFEELVALLDRINVAQVWQAATEDERRTLLDELLGSVTVLPDRLVVEVHGAPPLQVAFEEVGLKSPPDSEFRGVGGGT